MKRLLLATCLLLLSSTAFAKSPVNNEDPGVGSAKPGKAAAATAVADADAVAPAHAVAVPARGGATTTLPTRGGAPRWHSLLPGMIR
jgi:hypothetical protein